jgi:phosphoglycerol transferase MdoB-like AlkP superfamily enzyme
MRVLNAYLNQFKTVILFFIIVLAIFTVSRLGLVLWQVDRLPIEQMAQLLVGGLRVDLSSAAYITLPLVLLVYVSQWLVAPVKPYLQLVIRIYSIVAITLIVLIEAATPAFINQYDIRPNRLFIEYIAYPQEVFSMLLSGHLMTLVIALLCCVLTVYLLLRYYPKLETNKAPRSFVGSHVSVLLSIFILFVAARGTLGHRPLNPALVYFSQDSLVNSLVLNTCYSVAFALKNMADEKSAASLYGDLPKQQIIDLVRQASFRNQFDNATLPTLAVNLPYNTHQRKNLVIVLEESLGARFVGKLNGDGITPELDKLYEQGWGFTNLYATGTRSVRGIEAVITGFLPSPSRSVVKLSKSQQQFFTLADVLAAEGYHTQFIYGGESHFDNMKSFFLGNGFSDIVDFKDIQQPKFVASWGASDEDLFDQADQELLKLQQQQQPFFSLIFTSSNHDPFEIPPYTSTIPQKHVSDNIKRDRAINYADYALGKFIAKAKTQPYWQDTIFMIVADHDVRVYGSEPVPVKSFHIPAVILNSDFDNTVDSRLVSQIDLPVTLLSLIGSQAATPMTGLDLTKQYPLQRAMMQYYDNFAYIENDQVVVLMPGGKVSYGHYDVNSKVQIALPASTEPSPLKDKALAHVLFSSMAYQQQLYRRAVPASELSVSTLTTVE